MTEAETTESTPPVVEQITFADLGVMPSLCDALSAVGIVHPFPIQAMAIPIALTGTDMIGQARTGTGKTLAFGLTLLQRIIIPGDRDYDQLAKPGAPQSLVVCPTRELASQVSKDLTTASSQRGARVLTVYGGVGYEPQIDALATGVDVVVGTPGRLLDLVDRRILDLSHIKVLVLDEADEMLDLGFLPDVERILSKTPELRQTMLFSATMPSAIVSLARTHLRHPVNIRAESAGDETTVPTTAQFVYQAHDLDKPEVVARILQAENRNRVMIFCRTKRSAQRVADDLTERGFSTAPIHGDLSQIAREKALTKFREGGVDVLVATDVAARGIDVEGVTHVINYECPDDDKTYVHRIGRTGRAGASGVAITFVDWADRTRWKVINNTLGLPFEEPQETYSTSEHLYHDLGIDPGTKGRIVPARPSAAAGSSRSGSPRSDRPRRDTESGRREDRPRTSRQRRRTRNGEPVEASATSDAQPTAQHSAGPSDEAGTSGEGQTPRRRRRSRSRNSQSDSAPAQES
ncbi:superfamily II DNA/RNA helicase [Microlunatus panaciterrae]|uniref:RNA helicase n=1 Tax=Microlunatus panaciterrae TaxID=400768 RepID=A0ABS2REV1_9ACTN|nr:DEAD/DEAH box helicase [Microlunatus panaciterrae]MBM7797526.1 superfamily II DNA/RNA helicase [Microlunatus panaciterrae]